MKKNFSIGDRKIGEDYPCFIIAEMSGNHNQDINRAYEIIEAAAEAGVDAIKMQTYTPDTLTIDCDNEYFRIGATNTWAGQTLYELYKTAYTPWEWQPELKKFGEKRGLIVFSTPFDNSAVDFLEKMHVLLYKVASFEAAVVELLERIAQTGKPVILSRGLASIEEIELAINTLTKHGTKDFAILHCVSSYPALPEQMNLTHVKDIKDHFNVITGLSDHSLGTEAAELAVGEMQADIVEKHFTLKRSDGGPDAAFSLEPDEMRQLVKAIREIEKSGFNPQPEKRTIYDLMRGQATYTPDQREVENIVFKRSLFVVQDIKAGQEFTSQNIRSIRPGYGAQPVKLFQFLGKKALKDLKRGTPATEDLILS